MGYDGKIQQGWEEKRLDEIAEIRFSGVDKKIDTTQKPVILCNYMEVWKNPYIHAGLNFSSGSVSPEEYERFRLQPGDVLITKDSETREEIAEPSVVRDKIDNLVLGYHLALIRPKHNLVDGFFLAAKLRLPEVRTQFIRAAAGATRYGLGLEAVKSAKVRLPKLLVQRRIAEVLQSVDNAIDQTRAVIEQTRRVKTALLQNLLTHGLPGQHRKYKSFKWLSRIPSDWNVVQFKDISNVVRGSSPRPAGDPRYFNGNHKPWVTVLEVTRDDWIYLTSTTTMLTKEGVGQSRLLKSGTLILSNSGATLGVPKILSIESCANDGIAAFLDLNKSADKAFLYYYLIRMTSTFRDVIAPGLGQPNLNTDLIGEMAIPLPPIDEQRAIATTLFEIDKRIRSDEGHAIQLIQTKAALSQALLNGQIRIIK